MIKNAIVIDVKEKFITPGFIDMHSCVAIESWPFLPTTYDSNEATDQIIPYFAIDLSDPELIVASGGVTTSLVLPGSANLIGGEGFVIKMCSVDTLSVDDMGINANNDLKKERAWRCLKMACGENPKRRYGSAGRMPSTRMGKAWLFRKFFNEARTLMQNRMIVAKVAEKLTVKW
ncbi:17362_t:CDS:2 [Gigaspora rosea]|nr:17362_t:CDS:2 [Gigaspora rosea]